MIDPDQSPEARIRQIELAVNEAADVVSGEPGSNPLEVFPDPKDKERRADVVWGGNLEDTAQDQLREVMARVGPGREGNIGPREVGFEDNGYIALLEGGQPHKMIAEFRVILDSGIKPGEYIVTGSSDRELPVSEREIAAKLLNIPLEKVAHNELDMAKQVIRNAEGFYARDNSLTDMDVSNTGAIGEIIEIGAIDGRSVRAMDIPRTYDPEDSSRYTQMTNDEKIKLAYEGNPNRLPVGFVTSSTYDPSCQIAAIKSGVDAVVLTYGTALLGEVKGESPAQPSIAQLGAEAHKTASMLR